MSEAESDRDSVSSLGSADSDGRRQHPSPTTEPDATQHLPVEIMQTVFQMLDVESLIVAGQVCSRWRELSRTRAVWQKIQLTPDGVESKDTMEYSWLHWSDRELQGLLMEEDSPDEKLPPKNRTEQQIWMLTAYRQLLKERFLRKYFRVLTAAPYLNKLVVDCCSPVTRVRKPFIECTCKAVRSLNLSVLDSGCRDTVDPYWHVSLLQHWPDSIQELSIRVLRAHMVPAIDNMVSLRVLRFENTKDYFDSSKDGKFKPAVFKQRPPEQSTLREVWCTSFRVHKSTVCSLMNAHSATLRATSLPGLLTNSVCKALARCTLLETLYVDCQDGLDKLGPLTPSLRRLEIRELKVHVAASQLQKLPVWPLLEHLRVDARGRRKRLDDEVAAVALRMSSLPALRRVTLRCHRSKAVTPSAHLRTLQSAAAPSVNVNVDVDGEYRRYSTTLAPGDW